MEINSANSKVNVFVLLTNAILDFFSDHRLFDRIF